MRAEEKKTSAGWDREVEKIIERQARRRRDREAAQTGPEAASTAGAENAVPGGTDAVVVFAEAVAQRKADMMDGSGNKTGQGSPEADVSAYKQEQTVFENGKADSGKSGTVAAAERTESIVSTAEAGDTQSVAVGAQTDTIAGNDDLVDGKADNMAGQAENNSEAADGSAVKTESAAGSEDVATGQAENMTGQAESAARNVGTEDAQAVVRDFEVENSTENSDAAAVVTDVESGPKDEITAFFDKIKGMPPDVREKYEKRWREREARKKKKKKPTGEKLAKADADDDVFRDDVDRKAPEWYEGRMLPERMEGITELPRDVLEVVDYLDKTPGGRILNNISNMDIILSCDPVLRGGLRYNELTHRINVVKDMGWDRGTAGETMEDNDMHNIHLYIERAYHDDWFSPKLIEEAVQMVAYRNRFHPIREVLKGLEWDGKERVRHALHHFLGADESDYTYEVLKFFMLGAVLRVFRPGIKFDYILCVVGAQGAGKSSFFRFLALDDDWFTDDMKDLESGKVFEKLQGHWIVELSEMLATNNAKSNEAIKAFLSRQKEVYRTPYERYPKDRPRQCVFAGTTNKLSFLPNDRSGNRRFLPVLCKEGEAEVFILDNVKESREYIRQMWAEIMVLWRSGQARLKLPSEIEEEVRKRQMHFMQEDVDAGMILAYMQEYTGDKVCSKQLFREALHNGDKAPQRWQTNEINEIMNQLIREGSLPGWRYFDKARRFGGTDYGTQRGWERIENVNEPCQRTMSTDGDDENKTVPDEPEDALKTVSKEDLELFQSVFGPVR